MGSWYCGPDWKPPLVSICCMNAMNMCCILSSCRCSSARYLSWSSAYALSLLRSASRKVSILLCSLSSYCSSAFLSASASSWIASVSSASLLLDLRLVPAEFYFLLQHSYTLKWAPTLTFPQFCYRLLATGFVTLVTVLPDTATCYGIGIIMKCINYLHKQQKTIIPTRF